MTRSVGEQLAEEGVDLPVGRLAREWIELFRRPLKAGLSELLELAPSRPLVAAVAESLQPKKRTDGPYLLPLGLAVCGARAGLVVDQLTLVVEKASDNRRFPRAYQRQTGYRGMVRLGDLLAGCRADRTTQLLLADAAGDAALPVVRALLATDDRELTAWGLRDGYESPSKLLEHLYREWLVDHCQDPRPTPPSAEDLRLPGGLTLRWLGTVGEIHRAGLALRNCMAQPAPSQPAHLAHGLVRDGEHPVAAITLDLRSNSLTRFAGPSNRPLTDRELADIVTLLAPLMDHALGQDLPTIESGTV